MRPIDADALKDNMFGYAPPEMTWDRSDIEHKIDEMPTIDAIPVEWLRKKRVTHPTTDAEILHNSVIRAVLVMWEREQEANNEQQ